MEKTNILDRLTKEQLVEIKDGHLPYDVLDKVVEVYMKGVTNSLMRLGGKEVDEETMKKEIWRSKGKLELCTWLRILQIQAKDKLIKEKDVK